MSTYADWIIQRQYKIKYTICLVCPTRCSRARQWVQAENALSLRYNFSFTHTERKCGRNSEGTGMKL